MQNLNLSEKGERKPIRRAGKNYFPFLTIFDSSFGEGHEKFSYYQKGVIRNEKSRKKASKSSIGGNAGGFRLITFVLRFGGGD